MLNNNSGLPPNPSANLGGLRGASAGGLRGASAFLLSLLLVCIIWSDRGSGAFGVETDFYGCYAPQAKALLEHGTIPLDDFRGPLYPTLLAAVVATTPFDYFQSAFLINLICMACLFLIMIRFPSPPKSAADLGGLRGVGYREETSGR